MPPEVTGLNAHMRDHSIGIPVPENTIAHGIPNACNLCHQDKDAAWASRQMTAWYGAKSRQKWIRRADAFTQARQENAAAIPALLEILSDPSEGAWIRANAGGIPGQFPQRSHRLRRAAPCLHRSRAAGAGDGRLRHPTPRGPAGGPGAAPGIAAEGSSADGADECRRSAWWPWGCARFPAKMAPASSAPRNSTPHAPGWIPTMPTSSSPRAGSSFFQAIWIAPRRPFAPR